MSKHDDNEKLNETAEEIISEDNIAGEDKADENVKAENNSGTADADDSKVQAESSKEDKKSKKKDKKKDKRDEKIAELEDRVMRQMAEFQNFRNRSEKEKASMYEMGARSVIEKILPVIDNFERGLQSIPDDEQDTAIATGMNMIYKQLTTELESIGVKPIEAVGKEFDANFHNAVMQTESDEYESGIIAQELQKGYTYRDNVVRHSMVAVVS